MLRAACKDMAPKNGEPDPFFPEAKQLNQTGMLVCMDCPVRPQCKEYHKSNETLITHGIWGGKRVDKK